MKNMIIILAMLLCQTATMARERSDSFICYSDRKIESPINQEEIQHPWRDRQIPAVFDYENNKIVIYAKETLTLTINQVGKHYSCDIYRNAVDIQATDHLGRRVTCTFVIGEGREVDMLVVGYGNVRLVYRLRKVNKIP